MVDRAYDMPNSRPFGTPCQTVCPELLAMALQNM
jgi:hypothetical protein